MIVSHELDLSSQPHERTVTCSDKSAKFLGTIQQIIDLVKVMAINLIDDGVKDSSFGNK